MRIENIKFPKKKHRGWSNWNSREFLCFLIEVFPKKYQITDALEELKRDLAID